VIIPPHAGILLTAACAAAAAFLLGRRWSPAEHLRESVRQYQLLFDRNPLPMWVFDIETLRFLAVNDAAVAH